MEVFKEELETSLERLCGKVCCPAFDRQASLPDRSRISEAQEEDLAGAPEWI